MSEFKTEQVDGGYTIVKGGKVLVTMRGTEGSLKAEFPVGTRDAAQDCFDKCFAASDGTLGASHKCARDCGLT